MRVGIVSDTHSRYATVEQVVQLLRERDVDVVLHCGDIEDAATVHLFRSLPSHFVFGNCDSDRHELRAALTEMGATLHEPFGNLELAGKQLAWVHGDDARLFRDIERSQHFDFLFHGHTHRAEKRQSGRTRVINPGALHRARIKSFGILEVDTGEYESVELG